MAEPKLAGALVIPSCPQISARAAALAVRDFPPRGSDSASAVEAHIAADVKKEVRGALVGSQLPPLSVG